MQGRICCGPVSQVEPTSHFNAARMQPTALPTWMPYAVLHDLVVDPVWVWHDAPVPAELVVPLIHGCQALTGYS